MLVTLERWSKKCRFAFAIGAMLGIAATCGALIQMQQGDGALVFGAMCAFIGGWVGFTVATMSCMWAMSRMTITIERDDDADWWKGDSAT